MDSPRTHQEVVWLGTRYSTSYGGRLIADWLMCDLRAGKRLWSKITATFSAGHSNMDACPAEQCILFQGLNFSELDAKAECSHVATNTLLVTIAEIANHQLLLVG